MRPTFALVCIGVALLIACSAEPNDTTSPSGEREHQHLTRTDSDAVIHATDGNTIHTSPVHGNGDRRTDRPSHKDDNPRSAHSLATAPAATPQYLTPTSSPTATVVPPTYPYPQPHSDHSTGATHGDTESFRCSPSHDHISSPRGLAGP